MVAFGGPDADDPSDPSDPRTEAPPLAVDHVVVIVAPRSDDLDERAAQAITAHVRALEGQVRVVEGTASAPDPTVVRSASEVHFVDPHVRGVIWVDVATDGATELVLVPADDTRVYGSQVEVPDQSPALALEGLGNVVSSASAALLGGPSLVGLRTALVDENLALHPPPPP